MANIYFISPIGYKTPQLFDTFTDTFVIAGHRMVDDIDSADVVFIDLHTRIGSYEQNILDKALWKRKVVFDEFDYGSCSICDFPYVPQVQIQGLLLNPLTGNDGSIWFVRKLDRIQGSFLKNVYPYEKIIINEFPLVSKEELWGREYDMCWIGNESPIRKSVVNSLQAAGFNMYIHWTNEKGKLPFDEWIHLHSRAKFFLSLDGGGFSDERLYHLFSIAPMVKNRSNHLQCQPFKHGVSCLYVDVMPSQKDIEEIKYFMTENWLYSLYLGGYYKMTSDYTAKARAEYILDILSKNGIQ